VGDQVAFDSAVLKVHDMEARFARFFREIGDPDRVTSPDAMLVERGLGAREERGVDSRGRGWNCGRLCRNARQRVWGDRAAGLRRQDTRQHLRHRRRREDEAPGAGGTKAQHFPPIQTHSFPPLWAMPLSFNGLMADNPLIAVARPIV